MTIFYLIPKLNSYFIINKQENSSLFRQNCLNNMSYAIIEQSTVRDTRSSLWRILPIYDINLNNDVLLSTKIFVKPDASRLLEAPAEKPGNMSN